MAKFIKTNSPQVSGAERDGDHCAKAGRRQAAKPVPRLSAFAMVCNFFNQAHDPAKWVGGSMSDVPVNREFWNSLIRQVRSRTRGRADPEELLHAAYLRLLRYRAQHAVENVAAFLVRTAVNIGVDNYRHERFIADVAPDDVGHAENSPLQDEVLASRARLERVREGLSRLTPRTREIFLMHRLDELKYREIAERLGISQSAVEKHIAKAALFLTEWTEGW
ncbi:MAG: polymerase subunit sigma24 [Alphaproteobacteria bacterium]|jgi:RNA polymerase sigma factor (sigma-70 family)|nr:polymerase subunit sigma24 [Alphaproteobacteria bacterium]MDB5741343.1 polymerase subunit sigma24 [Alphaproteobacteria bacterium]